MSILKTKKSELIQAFKINSKDTGSSSVQIALLTDRINTLTDHFKTHKKDCHSRVGLLRMVSKRRSLLDYLKKSDNDKYDELVKSLNLRK